MESGHTVEWASEDNYMFRLSAFQDRLLEWIDSKPYRTFFSINILQWNFLTETLGQFMVAEGCSCPCNSVQYEGSGIYSVTVFLLVTFPAIIPESSRQWVRYWLLNESNSDLSVSRPRSRLQWGVPVPNDSSQTVCSEKQNYRTSKKWNIFFLSLQIYVWLDALVNYLTVSNLPISHPSHTHESPNSHTCNLSKLHGSLWPATNQIVGKDILRFHAIYWPAFLMAAQLPLPRRIISHAHWTVGRLKVS